MTHPWYKSLKYDLFAYFTTISNPFVQYFVRRDLQELPVDPVEHLWSHPNVTHILRKQQPDGSWPDRNPRKHKNSPTLYTIVETYRNLGYLVDLFQLDRHHEATQRAASFLFSTQSAEGDFRGVYGNQYSPNYSGGVLEQLVRAGYHEEPEIIRAFQWFLAHRQNDGGWTLPMQTAGIKIYESLEIFTQPTIPFDSTKVFSHFVTGIVIRAFAAHPYYRTIPEARQAGELLTTRFFQPDVYSARQAKTYWIKYSIPFWWTDLISTLDALSLMQFSRDNPGIRRALDYFIQSQLPSGTWDFYKLKGKGFPDLQAWLTLYLCRILKRFFSQ